MLLPVQIVEAIIIAIIGVNGIIINSAILSMYIRYWRKTTSLAASDPILLSMALTNLLLQCSLLLNSCLLAFQTQREMNTQTISVVVYVLLVLYNMSFWNTAWLSICYCVKLVTVTHRIFLWVKMWFPSSITKLLIGSAIWSVLVTLPFFWTSQMMFLQKTNITDGSIGFAMTVNVLYTVTNMLLSYILPFTLTAICIGLSVTSLLHHVWRIRQNVSQDSSSPQLQALVRAAVTMMLHVLLDLTFLIILLYTFAVSFHLEPVVGFIFWLFLMSYPSVQSFILIFGNPKLKRRLLRHQST
ncbi:taste receptor type 2 member 41-like [Pseudophryne corroboree]|uniref:taste receptor type 2 member 41-like n=1 Tax=Pseudophryne corroboree TaxID=495146 RepID=UPI003081D0D0